MTDRARMLAEVADGLARPQKELSPKYFYDRRGSELFEQITRLDEYYLTRAERALLEREMPAWIGEAANRTLVELGAGSATKTRILLDAMTAAGSAWTYVPVDVSAEFLDRVAAGLRDEYPRVDVIPLVADMTAPLTLPGGLPAPLLVALLGSTIGNFEPNAAISLLRNIARILGPADRFLLGVDLRKDPRIIEAAYNDARGVTAEFNRNVLRVLNRELGASFDVDAFEHRAFYHGAGHRIEMHLVATAPMRVTIPGAPDVLLEQGETIRTEISCKYDRFEAERIMHAAGMRMEEWIASADGSFALAIGAPSAHAVPAIPRTLLRRELEAACFAGWSGLRSNGPRIGAEVEFLVLDCGTGRPAPVESRHGRSAAGVLRRLARRLAWQEEASDGAPAWSVPGGGRLTFEPGGQIEYSSAVRTSASALLDELAGMSALLISAARADGMALISTGIDPMNGRHETPLRVSSERYRLMTSLFDYIGPFGVRMMRQTGAFQVSLDPPPDAPAAWRLLNACTPFLTAIFANSPRYEGKLTGWRSNRARCWRQLDPSRTGIFAGDRPVDEYFEFALDARAMFAPRRGATAPTFREWNDHGEPSLDDWRLHLTTLFPEVRPKGYLEVRSIDALPSRWHAAPVALLATLLYVPNAMAEAASIVGAPEPALLSVAARHGLLDRRIGEPARALVELVLAHFSRLPAAFLGPRHRAAALEFFDRYTRRGRSPSDDIVGVPGWRGARDDLIGTP